MEIDNILSLASQATPNFKPAFNALKSLWQTARQIRASKEQLSSLVHFGAQLLQTLNNESTAGRVLQDEALATGLGNFRGLVIDGPRIDFGDRI